MSQVDRETVVPLDPTTEAGSVHDRLRALEPSLREQLGELAVTGATPAEKLSLRETREHLSGIEQLARAAVAAIDETDIPLRASTEETLAGDEVYDVVKAFVDRAGGGFTLAQLKEHLRDFGYELPKNSKAFSRQFADWQRRIMEEKTNPQDETVPPERRRWIRLDARKYVLAWLETPPAKTANPKPNPQSPLAETPPPQRALAGAPAAATPAPELEASTQPERTLKLVSSSELEEDPVAAAALRIVQAASGEPARVLIGQLVKEMNMTAPAAREIFEALAQNGRIHRHNAEGRVRYSTEPPEPPQPSAARAAVSEYTPPALTGFEVIYAELVLQVLSGRGVPFGKAFTPQEISRLIGGGGDPDLTDVSPDEVKSVASYLQYLGLVTRIQRRQGRNEVMMLQISDRAVMTALKSPKRRQGVLDLITAGKSFTPQTQPRKRPPAKKKR